MINRCFRALLFLLPAMSPAWAQLGPVPLAGQAVQAQGASSPRPLAQKLADQLSIKDFGAACDGATDDSNAVLAAGRSGRRVTIPSGIVCNAPSVPQASMQGLFIGGGQIRGSDGNPRGPQFGAVLAPPNPAVWDQANSLQDNCSAGFPCWAKFDYSHTLSAEEFHVAGGNTLGTPTHNYQGMPGTNAHQLFIDNASGWNQSHNSNDGRTGGGGYSTVLQQNGAGDFGVFGAQVLCNGRTPPGDGNTKPDPSYPANGVVNGYTDWLAVPQCGFIGAVMNALAPAQYMQIGEYAVHDNGNDVSAIGSVTGYVRSSTTPPKLNNRWIHELTTCNLPNQRPVGAIPCDAAYVIGGQWLIGLDFAGSSTVGQQAVQYPMSMMAGQKISLNDYNNDSEGNPGKTTFGGDWISDDGSAIVLAQNSNVTARIYSAPNAVNGWQFTGSTTGNAVTLGPIGADAAVTTVLSDKGGGGIVMLSNGAFAMRAGAAANANGFLNVSAGTPTAALALQDYSLGNQDVTIGAAGTGMVRLVGTTPAAADTSNAVATTAFTQSAAKAVVSAMIGNRYKIAGVGSGAVLALAVPAGVVDQMIVEIVPTQATIATMSLTMPATAAIPDGFIMHFIATGTITSFTLAGNTGQTVLGAPGSISPASPVAFMWDSALSDWIQFR